MRESKDVGVGKLGLPRYLVMGHDLGIASDGYALIDLANHEILEAGSQLFKQPVTDKTHQSLAAVRRGYQGRARHPLRLVVQGRLRRGEAAL